MSDNSFKKKGLNKKDYRGKETAAKVVKGGAAVVGLAVIAPKVIKGVVNIAKKIITKA